MTEKLVTLDPDLLDAAAAEIGRADGLLITAGAGMGVDSGLPDFRGDQGFWRAYPPLETLGVSFVDMANPRWFERDPELAWGFYGHRLGLYRETAPHRGFGALARWSEAKMNGGFVVTSNVDGQFQRGGFGDGQVLECHGSIHHLQCTRDCGSGIWPASGVDVGVDSQFRATTELPRCLGCGAIARPNVLMFGDAYWVADRTEAQESRFREWVGRTERVCVIEFGAGLSVPTIRRISESVAGTTGRLIRVNPRDPDVPRGGVSLASGALAAIDELALRLR